MKSAATKAFWRRYYQLPEHVRRLARKNFRLWFANPGLPGLRFKALKGYDRLYSIRIGADWRALGRLSGDTIYWFWIGPHSEYDRLLAEGNVTE